MSKFYGIGVGPGDEKLLTLKAVEALEALDVLLIPETREGREGVAKKIANRYLKGDLIIEYIGFPMVADEDIFIEAGKKAAQIVLDHVRREKNVGFITLGDPGVYSTYGYIVKALDGRTEIETIPGITSFCAAAAMANKPLVEKDEILSIVPMNADDEQIRRAAAASDAVVLMKIYKREERTARLLREHKLDENAYLALQCGFEDAQIKEDVLDALKENKEYLSIVHGRKKRSGR